mmetsp:Transcript_93/g.164  ORF Transcript_93/g.164 Transcript_93/m.164 type:complete len:240 (+) Transcript_93:639-1358(+)
MRLDHFQGLVHESGGVASDLSSHVPVGMRGGLGVQGEGVVLRHELHLLQLEIAEGAATRGEDEAPQAALRQTLHALEEGGVLAVGGKELHTVLLKQRHNVGAGCDEGLLVGQADILSSLDGRHGRVKTRAPNNARDSRLAVGMASHFDHALGADEDVGHVCDALRFEKRLEVRKLLGVRDGDHLRLELGSLLGAELDVAAGGQRHHLELVRVLGADIQRLGPDGASGPEQRDLLCDAIA